MQNNDSNEITTNDDNNELETNTNEESTMDETEEGGEGDEDALEMSGSDTGLEADGDDDDSDGDEDGSDGDGEGEPETKTKEADKPKEAPAYLAFVAAAKAHGEALGLSSKDQKGYFQFWNATTGHKLYVAKQGRAVTRIDTTLPQDQLGGIAYDLEKPNGRIVCHVQATQDAVTKALDLLASFGEKIPAPKRPAKAAAAPAAV